MLTIAHATLSLAVVAWCVRSLRLRYDVFDARTGRSICRVRTERQAIRACESLDAGKRVVADYERVC